MEDDLKRKKKKNGRRPRQKLKIEDDLIFFEKLKVAPQKKWKMTSKKNIKKNGRLPQKNN